jgi:hypothetical protein
MVCKSCLHHIDIEFSDLPFDIGEMYSLMGYGAGKQPADEVQAIIDGMLSDMHEHCKPRIGYEIFSGGAIDKEHIQVEDVKTENIVLNVGKIIAYALHEAESFAIFTATAGSRFDKWLKKIEQEDDIVKAYLANTLGSVLVEAAVSLLMRKLEAESAAAGLNISNNYSPGYCDWLLVEQKKLLSVFSDGRTGITLTDSCLMLPIKSVSGIVGIGKNVKKRPYGCAVCKMKNCIRNKNKEQ